MWTFCLPLLVLFLILSVQRGLGSHPSSKCNSAFGLEGGIEDRWFSALSYYKNFPNGDGKGFEAHPRCARLNYHDCAWCAASENGQYLQVDLKSEVVITGIATQGFQTWSDSYFVTGYKVEFSRDRKTWEFLPQVMTGNHDGRSVVRHNFSSPMYARYIRVYPVAYRNKICMRMELYGCSNPPSALTTTPAPTTQSAANNTSENLPLATRATASTSTENPMINNSTTASSVLSTPSPTNQNGANSTTHENVPSTTGAATASSKEKPMISHSTTDVPTERRKISRTTPGAKETLELDRNDSKTKKAFIVTALVFTLVKVGSMLVSTICC